MSQLILTIDAGNTRVKWGLFEASGNMLLQDACVNTDLINLQLPMADKVMISNVAGDAVELILKKLLKNHTNVSWVTSQAAACGVTNSYENPAQLGTDRWAAIIAAAHSYNNAADLTPCIVVNAGTAVTVDVITFSEKLNRFSQAHFVGGIILPGLNLMQQSLLNNTANLAQKSQLESNQNNNLCIANNTKEAIYLGALNAICGVIDNIARQYRNNHATPHIILSGGDANIIQNSLTGDVTNKAVIVDNLVLQGLYLQSISELSIY